MKRPTGNLELEPVPVSKPSLYREFGSEDGLTCAVLDRYAEQVLSDMFLILHGGKGLHETLGRADRLRQ